ERVLDFVARFAKALPEIVDVLPEAREVLRDREWLVRNDVEAVRLAFEVAQPEHRRQRYQLPERLVYETRQHHGIGILVAERDGTGARAGLAALRFVVTQHIRPQCALPRVGARGAVVGEPLRRNEERRDGVDQRRLARPDVSRE